MSAMESEARHLSSSAHSSNSVAHKVSGTTMGGMVSAIGAVLCGTRIHSDDSPKEKLLNPYQYMNGHTAASCAVVNESDNERRPSTSDSSNYHTPVGSYSKCVEHQVRLDMPYMDEDSDISHLSLSSQSTPRGDTVESSAYDCGPTMNDTVVIEVSEGEYSADEEQEEIESEASEDELERIDGDSGDEETHECTSECDHSDVEEEVESEVDEEEHISDSEYEHSEEEEHPEQEECEYESEEVESDVEQDEDDDHQEVIEISENEYSCDESEQSEEEQLVTFNCDSNCPSDCEGEHHECSSECDCNQYQSETDEEPEKPCESDLSESELEHAIENDHITSTPPKANGIRPHMPILKELPKTSPLPAEKNNNQLHRHHSQRTMLPRQNSDILGELKTAIDARIRRSASCRETTSDYRKRYAQLCGENSHVLDNHSKLDTKEREMRRKERRSRLRTLELKREQCLDEVRDGTKENATDRIYNGV